MKYFSPKEFTCNGVNCFDKMSDDLLNKLDFARSLAGTPFKITSSWRSESHNKDVGGAKNSSHLRGTAVDISCNNSMNRFKIINALLDAGFTRIGIAKTFIHADVDEDNASEVIWLY